MSPESKSPKTYVCSNSSCTLGTRGGKGVFSGGITAEMVQIQTGQPASELEEGTDYGEGFCPNCGEKGKEGNE